MTNLLSYPQNGSRILLFWCAAMLVYFLMVYGSLADIGRITGVSAFDMRPTGYSYADALALISALGEKGRRVYLMMQIPLDTVYPALLAISSASSLYWLSQSFGTNARMTEMQASIGRVQLTRMPLWHARRLEIANSIWAAAAELSGLRSPVIPDEIEHAAYKCYVFVRPDALRLGWSRDRIMAEINELGVPCYSGSCSEVYLERAFDGTGFRPEQRLPVARELGETSLMFLCHPTLAEEHVAKTCDVLRSVLGRATR